MTADIGPRTVPFQSAAPRVHAAVPSPRKPCPDTAPQPQLPTPSRRSRARLVVPGLLLTADLAAFAAAGAWTAAFSVKTAALLLLLLVLFQTAGLYRRRLSFSILDDAPAIIGRSLAGGAAAMVIAGLNDGRAGTARLVTSALFGVLVLGMR